MSLGNNWIVFKTLANILLGRFFACTYEQMDATQREQSCAMHPAAFQLANKMKFMALVICFMNYY